MERDSLRQTDPELWRAIRRFNKGAILRDRHISYQTVGAELYFNCPFCGDERSRFYLNSVNGYCICHNCNWATRDFSRFIQSFLGYGPKAAREFIVGAKPRANISNFGEEKEKPAIEFPEGHHFLSVPAKPQQQRYWDYLRGRDIPPDRVLEYDIGYTRRGKYAGRIIIPIYAGDELVSWVARTIQSGGKKVLTPEGNEQSLHLFNIDRHWGRKEVALFEGPFDVLRLPDMAVGSFGKALHQRQVSLLRKAGVKRVVLGFDPDAWEPVRVFGRPSRPSAIQEAFKKLDAFDLAFIEFDPGEDPGSTKEAVLRDMVMRAKPLTITEIVKRIML